jgi:hypothetical protein
MVGTSNLGWNGHWINITMFLRYSLATSPIPKNMWFWTWCSRLFHWSSQQLPNSAARSAVRFRPAHSHQKSHRTLMRCSPFPRIQDEVIPLSGMVPNLVPNLWLVSNFLIPNVQTSMNAFCMRIYCIHVSPNLTVSHHIPYIIKKNKTFSIWGYAPFLNTSEKGLKDYPIWWTPRFYLGGMWTIPIIRDWNSERQSPAIIASISFR